MPDTDFSRLINFKNRLKSILQTVVKREEGHFCNFLAGIWGGIVKFLPLIPDSPSADHCSQLYF